VDYIGNDATREVQDTVHAALAQVGNLSPSLTEPYTLLCTYTVQFVLGVLTALIGVIIAYGAIGATIIGLLGPIFIPWMVFSKTEFLFWGWLKAFLEFEFYKVVAAATMSVMSHLLITYLTSGAMNVNDPQRLVYLMPGLLILCFVAGFILLKIPAMTASLFSGHTGGHDGGMGMATGLIATRLLR
jgi:type IV secretory pathway VirB6-like protein